MRNTCLIASALLAFAAFALLSLLGGASYLEVPLPGDLPLGNALAALGLCTIAGAAVALSAPGSAARATARASLIGAGLWLPTSALLAGNAQLNFAHGRGLPWLALSAAIAAAAIGSLLWVVAASALAAVRRRKSS